MATINLKVPDELRDEYRVACAIDRITMRDDLLRYITERVKAMKRVRK